MHLLIMIPTIDGDGACCDNIATGGLLNPRFHAAGSGESCRKNVFVQGVCRRECASTYEAMMKKTNVRN